MEDTYLIEIRLGKTKWRVKETIFAIGRKFRLGPFIERHPHVTLFGPLTLNDGINQEQLLDTIGKVASGFDPIPFMIDGWEKREGMHGSVIAFPVKSSESLRELTALLANVLTPLTHSHNGWDAYPDKKWFHVTVANRLEPKKAADIFSIIKKSADVLPHIDRSRFRKVSGFLEWLKQTLHLKHRIIIWPVTLDETGLRITVMHGEKIEAEYDLISKCWVFGEDSHSSQSWQKTLRLYRCQAGFELTDRKPEKPDEIFVISDLHLSHTNIIRYCSRPFLYADPEEMDRVLIANWNSVISETGRAYFLGDFRYGAHAQKADHYRKQLQGNITFIAGNHDGTDLDAIPLSELDCQGFSFLLIHDPADTPADFPGWVIHGHHHNNDLHHYPFINFKERRINVSAEVIGYVPISLHEICHIIQSRQISGNTEPLLLKYPYTR
jgi:calcineurin-like phosphoesterase family protein